MKILRAYTRMLYDNLEREAEFRGDESVAVAVRLMSLCPVRELNRQISICLLYYQV
jgi:hypothetical protein